MLLLCLRARPSFSRRQNGIKEAVKSAASLSYSSDLEALRLNEPHDTMSSSQLCFQTPKMTVVCMFKSYLKEKFFQD